MRHTLIALTLMTVLSAPVGAQFRVSIGLPDVRIGINLPVFPQLVLVPGYPVYYAPGLPSNYFFYEGQYWVYENDNWFVGDWYNGPWARVDPVQVPLFVLRVPVRYYRSPPSYFGGWAGSAPPRWGEHWGADWRQQRPGWDRWNRARMPAPAPLPSYQVRYPESRYPHADQQREVRQQNERAAQRVPSRGPVRERFQSQPPAQEPARARGPEKVQGQGQGQGQDRGNDRGRDKGRDKGNDQGRDKGQGGERDKAPGR